MTRGRELALFAGGLAILLAAFFAESLCGGQVLSSADVLLASASFRSVAPFDYEPKNRLLMDPTLQFEPWIEFNRRLLRSGRIPLWNSASGCGAPHLANGQAAVFDPFQMIAYLGTVPAALGWMALARLWFAGMGMFLLARAWGLRCWGRWFAGLTFPLSGFLIVWLLYPVTNAAIWLPWVFLATQGVWDRPCWRRAGGLAVAVGETLLGGHVQTAAHVLLAGGAYAVWLGRHDGYRHRKLLLWGCGTALGISLAAIEVIPLAAYLTRSPVWADRDQERVPPWKVVRPRVLESLCTAFPSLYGSQRRGEPNLAHAIGLENQNESAGGYAGLATLIWLAPVAWGARRENPRIKFLVALTLFGSAAAFRFPPVDNLLRFIPVLKVTDNRRMTQYLAFGLVLLGGIGLDHLSLTQTDRRWRPWGMTWVVASILAIAAAWSVGRFAPMIHDRALAHYDRSARETPGADLDVYRARADRQTEAILRFVPFYLTLTATEGLVLGGLLWAFRRHKITENPTRALLLVLTVAELVRFGSGLNPAIKPTDDRPLSPLIVDLRREVGDSGRIIGLGAEFPPNSLMRYGLRDIRNYDSVETRRNLDWFRPLYDPRVVAQTSRRDVTWGRVAQARDRLRIGGVRAVVGPSPPPAEFTRVTRYDAVWVAWLDADPLIELEGPGRVLAQAGQDGAFAVEVEAEPGPGRLVVHETFDPGWRAEINGITVPVVSYRQTFLVVDVPPGRSRVVLRYDPLEVRIAWVITGLAVLGVVFALTRSGDFRSTRSVVPRLGRTQAFGLESDS